MPGSRDCPQCGVAIDGDAARFCPRCGYYVQWTVEADDPPTEQWSPDDISRGHEEPTTNPIPRQAPPPPTPPAPVDPPAQRAANGPGQPCPRCAAANPPERTWCVQCGERLGQPESEPPPTYAPPPRESRGWLYVVGGAAAVLAAVVLILYLMRDDGGPPEDSAAAPVRVDSTTIEASATSELAPSGELSYFAGNTLDGDRDTAWNHDGADGPGVGERVSYSFAEPVDLVHVVIVNGYAKSADVFEQNGRVQEALLITDSGSVQVTLDDHADPQEIAGDFGRTSALTIEVISIYEGSRFPDLALTAVEFFAEP